MIYFTLLYRINRNRKTSIELFMYYAKNRVSKSNLPLAMLSPDLQTFDCTVTCNTTFHLFQLIADDVAHEHV